MIPPSALTWLAHSSYPRWTALPESAKSPVRETDAPITSGVPAFAEAEAPELLVLDAQAPRVSAATAAMTPTPLLRHKRLPCCIADPPSRGVGYPRTRCSVGHTQMRTIAVSSPHVDGTVKRPWLRTTMSCFATVVIVRPPRQQPIARQIT